MSTLPAAIGDLVRELVVNDGLTPEEAARRVVAMLGEKGYLAR